MAADKNYESHVTETNTIIESKTIPSEDANPLDYSDILKFSNCNGVTVKDCTVLGGKEDCIDAVRGSRYTFENIVLSPVHNGITLKGSVDTAYIVNADFKTHGKDCDIELGQYDNYWYIGRPPTRNIHIMHSKATDGKPIVIKLWDADPVIVVSSNVKIIRIPKLIWFPYFVFRAVQTRGIRNITKPVDGNSFIKTK